MRWIAVLLLALPLFGFMRPIPIDNQASLYHLLGLLAQHDELRPCVEWLVENDVVFWPRDPRTMRQGTSGWGALRPGIIFTPTFIGRGPASASNLLHEIKHLQGSRHPEVYSFQWTAAKILKAPEWHMDLIRKYAGKFDGYVPRLIEGAVCG